MTHFPLRSLSIFIIVGSSLLDVATLPNLCLVPGQKFPWETGSKSPSSASHCGAPMPLKSVDWGKGNACVIQVREIGLFIKYTQFSPCLSLWQVPMKRGTQSHCWVQLADHFTGHNYGRVASLIVKDQVVHSTGWCHNNRIVHPWSPRQTESPLIFATKSYAGFSSHFCCSGLGILVWSWGPMFLGEVGFADMISLWILSLYCHTWMHGLALSVLLPFF